MGEVKRIIHWRGKMNEKEMKRGKMDEQGAMKEEKKKGQARNRDNTTMFSLCSVIFLCVLGSKRRIIYWMEKMQEEWKYRGKVDKTGGKKKGREDK